ncbi:prolyl oligopeptidase family serine peptidase [Fulvivirgaceae bacterium BMA12]|uniref:Prolyl oligopeptidase family serine peptidase n=1 Tax=Agaribacillus aureus TaxID=3051825 RepID=A0ABT8LB18_9BACT|nr:prolyl oligopeptidase family serine peptidase [Fulvivirgaceae bacterium BMA12]
MARYKALLFILCLLLVKPGRAQTDGQIIVQKKITGLDQYMTYIVETEERHKDSLNFDPNRFEHFKEVEIFGITYYSDGLKVRGFLLKPGKPGKYPAVIYNRGGSLDFGSLTSHHASIGLGELARLARAGYVVVASQYRGNGGSEGQEEYGGADINDVLNLIPLLAAVPEADTSRLGMFGWSRGGMTSFLTLKRTNKIKALAVGGPSTDITRSSIDRPELLKWWQTFIPGIMENEYEVLKKRSAIHWVDELPTDVPMLILQGTADTSVKARYTLEFALKLDQHKIPYRLVMYEDGVHSLKGHRDEVFDQIIRWYKKYL